MIIITLSEKVKDQIVKYYNSHREDRGIVDKIIIKFKISKSTLYNILDERDIELYRKPTIISEDDEYEDEEDEENEITDDDKSISGNIILAKIEEYWGDRKDISLKNKDVAYSILKSWEIKYGVDSWKMWEDFVIDTEKILSRNELEKALQDIKENRNPFESFESVLQDYTETSAREVLKSLQQPETPEPSETKPKPQKDMWSEMLRFTDPKMYMVYKLMTDPKVKEGFINAYNQLQQLVKSKKPNPKNKNLKQKKVENIKPKEKDVDLRKAITESMPEPLPKRAHSSKKKGVSEK